MANNSTLNTFARRMPIHLCPNHYPAIAIAAVVVAVAFSAKLPAQTESPQPPVHSLSMVPKSAAFYLASMNHQAQFDALANSRAWRNVRQSPVGQAMQQAYRLGRRRGWDQFGHNPFREYLEAYSNTIGSVSGRMVKNYAAAMFKNEAFVYADADWITATKAFGEVYTTIATLATERPDGEIDAGEWEAILPVIERQLEGVNTPTIVFGTVVDEPELVKSLFQMAATAVDQVFSLAPPEMDPLIDAYQVVDEEELYLLSLTLTGEMIPWEANTDPDLEEILPFLEVVLRDKSLNICMGIKGRFMVVGLGPSDEHIRALGEGDLLIDDPQMKHVRQALADGKALSGVTYASAEFRAQQRDVEGVIDYFAHLLEGALREASDSADIGELIASIHRDADELTADLQSISPKPGAYVGYNFLTQEGVEGFIHDWSDAPSPGITDPLNVLQHVGPSPAFVLAAHETGSSMETYQVVSKWIGKGFDYSETLVSLLAENDEQRAEAEHVLAAIRPIVRRFDAATAEKLLPAMRTSQFALIIDLNQRKTSWIEQIPPSTAPLPFPAIAAVIAIQDPEMIRQAGTEYRLAANDLVEFLRSLPDTQIPHDFVIPEPQVKSVADAQMYYYPLPEDWKLDSDLVPHALLDERWLILGNLSSQTAALRATNHPQWFGPAAETDGSPISVAFYDHRQTIDALYAWGLYGLDLARNEVGPLDIPSYGENELLDFSEGEVLESLDHVMAMLKCFHGYSSATYAEDGATVTHYLMKFADVDGHD